ncbi:MAG: TIGR03067 domain-containing protein [Planctomycetes bacterium]|nr:TIGR03067 domain-containing protein [Planctomycetota bacterium]
MLSTTLVRAALFCLAWTPSTNADQAKNDLDRMQGTWIMHALEINGKEVGPQQLQNTVLTIKGDAYTTKVKDKEIPGVRLKLDPSKNPKAVDIIKTTPGGGEEVIKGIYTVESDVLKICRGLSADQDRPNQFATWPNTNYFVVTWKKQPK